MPRDAGNAAASLCGTEHPRGTNRPGGFAGYTLVEMLTTVAVLVIVLGLMVGLARHVRERSAQALTKAVLRQLDGMMTRYADRHEQAVPAVAAFPPSEVVAAAAAPASSEDARPAPPLVMASPSAAATNQVFAPSEPPRADRQVLRRAALANSRDFVAALKAEPAAMADRPLSGLPVSVYDESHLRDAWGTPIVFMPAKHPWVGTAPRDKAYFFFSAGPDRDYLTRDDNLYSYEEIAGTPVADRP